MSVFSTRLKELRREAGISQQALANIIGTSKSSINMYERGDREPGLETVSAFAEYFNVKTDYLLGKTDIKQSLKIGKMQSRVIASNIKLYREQKGLSQKQLADLLGISESTLANIESKKENADVNLIEAICNILGISVSVLDGSITDENEKNTPAAPSDEDIKVALFGGDTEVTDEMWSEVMNYAEFIKQKYKKT